MIDQFTIIDQGRELLTMAADDARDRFKRIQARFPEPPGTLHFQGALDVRQNGRDLEILANGNSAALMADLQARRPEELRCEGLSLEEIFVASRRLVPS